MLSPRQNGALQKGNASQLASPKSMANLHSPNLKIKMVTNADELLWSSSETGDIDTI